MCYLAKSFVLLSSNRRDVVNNYLRKLWEEYFMSSPAWDGVIFWCLLQTFPHILVCCGICVSFFFERRHFRTSADAEFPSVVFRRPVACAAARQRGCRWGRPPRSHRRVAARTGFVLLSDGNAIKAPSSAPLPSSPSLPPRPISPFPQYADGDNAFWLKHTIRQR